MQNNVLAQIAELPKLSIPEVKKLWRDLYGSEPQHASKSYLIKQIAYRLQEVAHGVDTAKIENQFAEAAKGKYGRKRNRADDIHMPANGTRLTREWQGEEHHVTVMADGFEYRGQRYRSLSIIARTITGSVWSGPKFFGLK
jgi:hypothetical protein